MAVHYFSATQNYDISFELFEKNEIWRRKQINNDVKIAVVVKMESDFLNKSNLEYIITLINKTIEVDIAYSLFLESLEAFENFEYRKAVIESANSIELVLGKIMVEELKIMGESSTVIEKRLDDSNFGSRLEFCTQKKVVLPTQHLKLEAKELRNSVMHKAKMPNENETRLIIEHCRLMLNTFMPL